MVKENGAWKAIDVGRRAHAGEPEARRSAEPRRPANAVFLNQHETGSFPALPRCVARRLRHAAAPQRGLRVRQRGDRGESPHVRCRVAATLASRTRSSSSRSAPTSSTSWGMSVPQQLDFADARAKLDGAPRFVYIGPRRSLTGLNADQWIACKPGTELAIANALAKKTAFNRRRPRAASTPRRSRSADELAASSRRSCSPARPAPMRSRSRSPSRRSIRRTARSARRSVPRSRHRRSTESRPTTDVLDVVERMRAGLVPIAFVRGVQSGVRASRVPRSSPRRSRRCRSRSASRCTRTRRPSCATSSSPICTRSNRGATPSRCAERSRCSSRRWIRCSRRTRGRLPTCSSQWRRRIPPIGGTFPAADYRDWLHRQFPGRRSGIRRRGAEGRRGGDASAATVAHRPSSPGRKSPAIGGTQGDFFLVTYLSPVLGDGRGANKPWLQELPDPVTKMLWSSWVEIHPETAQRLGIDRGDIVEVKTANGTMRAPAFLYLGIRPDTIAHSHRAGTSSRRLDPKFEPKSHDPSRVQWGYGRYARDIGATSAI